MNNPARVTLALYALSEREVPEAQRDAAREALGDLQDDVSRGRLAGAQATAREATDADLLGLLAYARTLETYQRASRACQLYLVRVYPGTCKVSSYAAKDHRAARRLLSIFTAEATRRLAHHKAAAALLAKALKAAKK